MNKQKLFLTAGGIILIGVIFWGAKNNFSLPFFSKKQASAQELEKAKTVAASYIRDVLLQGQDIPLEITGISEESGLYKLDLDIQGNQIATYMTKDLKVFFPNPQYITVAGSETQATQIEYPKSDKPTVELFIMSYCPYGNQAENIIKPAADLLKNKIDLSVRYILDDKGTDAKAEERFDSLHGVEEFKQNIREMCIQNEQNDKFWDYLEVVNADCTLENINTCWKTAANKVKINTAQVESCYNKNALNYGEQEASYTQEKGISGSPTLLINGVTYAGGRTSEDYKQAICSAFNQTPEECGQELSSSSDTANGSCN